MHYICSQDELIENQPRSFTVEDREIILVNWFGVYHAYLNDCPHAGWPLNVEPDRFLDNDHQYLQCFNHMALFDVDTGDCVSGPCQGCALTRIPLEIRDSELFATTVPIEDPES